MNLCFFASLPLSPLLSPLLSLSHSSQVCVCMCVFLSFKIISTSLFFSTCHHNYLQSLTPADSLNSATLRFFFLYSLVSAFAQMCADFHNMSAVIASLNGNDGYRFTWWGAERDGGGGGGAGGLVGVDKGKERNGKEKKWKEGKERKGKVNT